MADEMSLEELAVLCGGKDFWRTHAFPKHGIPAIMMSDGPHGLRKQDDAADCLGIHDSVKAICFPAASCLAASFDKDAAYRMGRLLGEEARAEGVQLVLGPAVNIKRSPLCGRNFEYFSEDPYLTGEMAAEIVRGIQSTGVGACVKHFAANNQENYRMVVSADMDERTLREIYLRAFERVAAEQPRAVMSSYNRINGEYVGESKRLLTDILRGEWNFQGIVVSDWYAVNDRVKALLAGLDLEMPGGANVSPAILIEAAQKDPDVRAALAESAARIAKTARALPRDRTAPYDKEAHHAAAVNLACACAVLLKNRGIFPVNVNEKILLVGGYAQKPRFQGGGSSHVNAFRAQGAAAFLRADYLEYDGTETARKELRARAADYDKVVVFVGLPDACESEGYDRKTLDLPASDNLLVQTAADCGKPVGVVLSSGAPVTMPWLDRVDGLLYMGLAGEGSGEACARLLTGQFNPSGRLAESYPLRIEHTPAYLNNKGTRAIRYAEGVFVGYRYYATKKIPVLFPFGYGLSYTRFAYSDLRLDLRDGEVRVSVTVENTGSLDGQEAVQVYVTPPQNGRVDRPTVELKEFAKIALAVGEKKTASFTLPRSAFAYYDPSAEGLRVEGGLYRIFFGRSCAEEILGIDAEIAGDGDTPIIDDNTTFGELLDFAPTAEAVGGMVKGYFAAPGNEAIGDEMKRAMLENAPLRLIKGIAKLDADQYRQLKEKLIRRAENREN